MKRFFWLLALVGFCVLAFTARCWNLRDVFIEGRIYFIDADCYSRMTRAAHVAESRAWIIKHHDFENWPAGITPHTTAPMDWLIVAGKWLADGAFRVLGSASILRGQTLDLAGALISPLLGVVTCAFLGIWSRAHAPPGMGLLASFLFAISPILVHGTALGRPDHQSLLILLLAVVIGAEVRLTQNARESGNRRVRKWSIIGGVAGGLAMWVSLYEPLILFGVIFALLAVLDRQQFSWRERWVGWSCTATIYAGALLIEGWRISLPDESARPYLANWTRSIGELAHLDLTGPVLWHWCGWAVAIAPITLGVAIWRKKNVAGVLGSTPAADRSAALLLGLLLVTFALTCWQVRWGYFFVLVFAMSLPWQFAAARRAWVAWPVFLLSLYPVAQDWDARLFPDEEGERARTAHRAERAALRDIVSSIAADPHAAFLAPWWQSPAIAYWTRRPGVAGSSHESLPGIVATARFYLAEKPEEAAAILQKHRVGWVLADDAGREIETSAALLGIDPPATPLAIILEQNPRNAPPFLREVAMPSSPGHRVFYHLYKVDFGDPAMP